MADKERNKMQPPKAPRPGYQMWIILVAVAVIFVVVWATSSNNLKEIDQPKLESMIKAGDVKKVALIKEQEMVEITLIADALKNAKYSEDIKEGPLGSNTAGPHYKLKVISVDNFDSWYRNVRADNKPSLTSEVPGWHEPGSVLENMFNLKAFNELPEHLKVILETASARMNVWVISEFEAKNNLYLQKLVNEEKIDGQEI